jgi:hypothetical protein
VAAVGPSMTSVIVGGSNASALAMPVGFVSIPPTLRSGPLPAFPPKLGLPALLLEPPLVPLFGTAPLPPPSGFAEHAANAAERHRTIGAYAARPRCMSPGVRRPDGGSDYPAENSTDNVNKCAKVRALRRISHPGASATCSRPHFSLDPAPPCTCPSRSPARPTASALSVTAPR